MTPLHFEPVGADLSTIWPLYESSFPWVERRSAEGLQRVLRRPGFRLERVVDPGAGIPLGFGVWSYDYYQPSYHEGGGPLPMRLLGLGTDPSRVAFDRYVTQIHAAVYATQTR